MSLKPPYHEKFVKDCGYCEDMGEACKRLRNKPWAAKCRVPPPGWTCSRVAGHDGPCAARPDNERISTEEAMEMRDRSQFAADGYPIHALAEDLIDARREVIRVRDEWHKRYFDATWQAECLYQAHVQGREKFTKETMQRYEDWKKDNQAR